MVELTEILMENTNASEFWLSLLDFWLNLL